MVFLPCGFGYDGLKLWNERTLSRKMYKYGACFLFFSFVFVSFLGVRREGTSEGDVGLIVCVIGGRRSVDECINIILERGF